MCSINVQIMEVEEKIASATAAGMPQAEIEVLKHELTSLEAQFNAKPKAEPKEDLDEVNALGRFIFSDPN